jgi:hypothetical protein
MKTNCLVVLLLVALVVGLSACGEEQPGQKAAVEINKAAPAAPAQSAAVVAPVAGQTPALAAAVKPGDPKGAQGPEDPPPPLAVPQGYRYEPRGRRDPFVNPLPKTEVVDKDGLKPVVRPDGLPGVLVSEVRLSGIVNSSQPSMKKAMLVVGKSTYFAKQGDSLFDGVLKEIRSDEVIFLMVSSKTKEPVNRETVVRTGGKSTTLAGDKK